MRPHTADRFFGIGSTGDGQALPFVGREGELARLCQVLIKPLPAGVLISGEAGIGKTRLLAEFANRAALDGWAVEAVTGAVSTSSVPMGALAQLMPSEPPAFSDPSRFLAAIREEFLARHEGDRLLLVIDDAPRLDTVSAGFVAQLAVMGYCLVAYTARTGEQLAPQVEALTKDQLVDELVLGPLADSDIEALVRTSLQAPIDPVGLGWIVRLSEGNPLFLREILSSGIESDGLTKTGDRWVFHEPVGMSPGLERLVTDRIGQLSEPQRAGLETLAVAEPIELHLFESLFDSESLVDLERRDVVQVVIDGKRKLIKFVHPLFADVIRAGIPAMARRHICVELLEVMQSLGGNRREDILRMALWHLDSDHPLDAERLVQAAKVAVSTFDVELGERIARAAVEAKAGPSAQLALADAISKQLRIEEAEELITAIDLTEADEPLLTEALPIRAANLGLRGDDCRRAVQLLEAGRSSVSDPDCLAGINLLLATCKAFAGDPTGSLEASVRVINAPGSSEATLLESLTTASLILLWLCRFDELDAVTRRGLELSEGLRQCAPDAREKLLMNRHNGHTYAGEILQAEEGLRQAYEDTNKPPVHPFSPLIGVWLADTLSVRGEMNEAASVSTRAMHWSGLEPLGGVRCHAAAILAVVAGRAGNGEMVEVALQSLESGQIRVPPAAGWRLRALAWQQAMLGNHMGAAELALEAGQNALDVGIPLFAAWTLHEAVMFGHPVEAAGHLTEIANSSGSPTLSSFAAQASALENADPTALTRVATSFAARGELLFAARAYRQAAELHHQRGKPTLAARATTAAQHLKPDLPGLGTWGPETEQPHHLTPREAEIARLAATGLTSQQIADQLFISARTVDNHLATTYTKLGIHSRDDLTSVLPSP